MIAVVSIHVMAAGMPSRGPGAMSTPLLFNTYSFIWFATPSFAFLTGALIWASHRRIDTWADYWSFLRRRAGVVLVPYLVWSAVYIVFRYYTPGDLQPQMPLWSFVLDVVKLLLLGRASFHLYFIPVVLEFYLVAPLVARAFARQPWLTGLTLWAVGAFTTLIVKAPPSDHLVTAYRMLGYTVWLLPAAAAGGWYGVVRRTAMPVLSRVWPLFLAAGLTLRWLDRGPWLLTVPWQQRVIETSALVFTIIGLVTALDMLVRVLPGLAPITWRLGSYSFGVYLVHPFAIYAMARVVTRLGLNGMWVSPWFTIAAIVAVAVGCFASVGVLMRYPAVAWVFGRSMSGAHPHRSAVVPAAPAVEPVSSGAGGTEDRDDARS